MSETYQLTAADCDAILAQFDSTPVEFQPELDAILADVAAMEFAARHPEENDRFDGRDYNDVEQWR